MAGWLVIWSRDGSTPEGARWSRAIDAGRRGAAVVEHARPGVAVAAWRRSRGEFPHSGTLAHPRLGTIVAWVGQTLDDDGDTSPGTIASLAAGDAPDEHLASINGPFAAAVVGPGAHDVRLVLDRHRHYPVYLHRGPVWTVASTELSAVLPWIDRPAIDPASIQMLLRCGEMIDDATVLRGVELLPGATVLCDGLEGVRRRRYWAMRHRDQAGGSETPSIERLGTLFTRGVRRMERASSRLAITLSGGLDSRFILGVCERRRQIPAFTWGLPGCRDIACAAAFARRIGATHYVRHWEPQRFPPVWCVGADLTAGSFGVDSMHMLPFVDLLAEHADVIFNGLAGDVVLGGNFVKLAWLRETDAEALAEASWRWRVSPALDAWADRLAGRGDARRRWVESIVGTPGTLPIARLHNWLYPNRVFRYTNSGTMLLRHRVESHAPFWDNDFLDAALALPLELKLKHRLYLSVMRRACPDAAATPWQRTMIPPAWGFVASGASMAGQRVIKAALGKVGIAAFRSNAVADVAGWLRGEWHDDVRDVVLSGLLCSSGLIDRSAAEALLAEHQSGADRSRTIGAIVAVEHFARHVRAVTGVNPC